MPHIVGEPGPSWGQNEVSQRAGVHGQQRSMSEVGRSPGKHKEQVTIKSFLIFRSDPWALGRHLDPHSSEVSVQDHPRCCWCGSHIVDG